MERPILRGGVAREVVVADTILPVHRREQRLRRGWRQLPLFAVLREILQPDQRSAVPGASVEEFLQRVFQDGLTQKVVTGVV